MIASNKKNKKFELESSKDTEKSSNYLDIWRVNPSYKDFNVKRCTIMIVFMSIMIFLTIVISYMFTLNIFLSLGIALFTSIFFIIAFSDDLFSLQNNLILMFRERLSVKPFENFEFWMLDQDPKTLLILNKKDALTIVLRMFKVRTIAENVYPTINQFLKATFNANLQFSYQVVQRPKFKLAESQHQIKHQKLQNERSSLKTMDPFKTSIYFSVYTDIKGVLNRMRLIKLLETIKEFSNTLESHLSSNFHHTKVKALSGKKNLINAIRTFYSLHPSKTKQEESKQEEEYDSDLEKHPIRIPLKLSFLLYIMVYSSIILFYLNFSLFIIIFANLTVFLCIIFLFWRDLISYFSDSNLRRMEGAKIIDPFNNVEFYRLKRFKHTLFLRVDEELLLAIKMYNLRSAVQPSITYPERVFRELIKHKIAFSYNLCSTPATEPQFKKEYLKRLNTKTQEALEGIIFFPTDRELRQKPKYPKAEFEQWLLQRTGIWKTSLNFSIFSYTSADTNDDHDYYNLERETSIKIKTLKKAFEDNFLIFKLMPLKNQKLISGIKCDVLKNTLYRLNGTHLNYLYFQGKNLMELAKVVSEFKKGIKTRIAAEFNTPLHLENFITIGHTINTEFLEKEILAGFKLKQLKQLLITNGISEYREHLKMKIVAELTKADISCVIFDYTGDWSKLIRYFKNSHYENKFLHFKFGQSFNVNLIYSGIKYDSDNHEFLSYFYDVFVLAFKAQKYTIDLVKKALRENNELDWSSLATAIKNMPNHVQRVYSESVQNLFKDFIDQSVFFSDKALEFENDIAPLDFIKTDKTIIIDLSSLKDLEQQVFATFVMISKFVHYINHSNKYYKKIIFIPHVDLFFDRQFIDNNNNAINYGKIDKLIAPLIQNGFGLVFSANQIHYLHPNIFSYMQNIITFQATDSRDIATLKNSMHLQELHGTGYYSSKRNETYQIQYLMSMRKNEIIVKREDIYQPFPVKIEWKPLVKMIPLSDESIYEYMEEQGYKLKLLEQKLMAKLKRTIFEKDLGIYSEYIKDVKKFFESIKKFDGIALNKRRIKEGLLGFIKERASKKTRNRQQIVAIRNDLFDILVKHGYLFTHQSHMPSGGDAMYTSYAVGEQYRKALEDEMQVKRNKHFEVDIEPIYRESNSEPREVINSLHFQNEFNDNNFHSALSYQDNRLYQDLYMMYKLINRREFEKSLDLGKNLIRTFFTGLFRKYNDQKTDIEPSFSDLEAFIRYLVKHRKIPLTITEIRNYTENVKQILYDDKDLSIKASSLYGLVSDFRVGLQRSIALTS